MTYVTTEVTLKSAKGALNPLLQPPNARKPPPMFIPWLLTTITSTGLFGLPLLVYRDRKGV